MTIGIQRREFMITLGSAAVTWPIATRAQQALKIFRVGLLAGGPAVGATDERRKTLLSDLAAQDIVEGKNLVLVQRFADGHFDRLNSLAAELKDANVGVIVTFGFPAALAAKVSAKDVAVVILGAGDPVATGLVEGVSRPGGNLTGVTELSTELSAKRLEILKDTVPNLQRVAMLWNAADLGMTLRYRSAEDAAHVLGVKVQALGVREPNDFEDAFAAMMSERPDAILMVSDALTLLNRKRVVEFANANRLPSIFENSSIVHDGGLMSYGPNQSDIGECAAALVVRILRGARPADLPLELPTRFDFVINLKTAKALGLAFPPTISARADEVIE